MRCSDGSLDNSQTDRDFNQSSAKLLGDNKNVIATVRVHPERIESRPKNFLHSEFSTALCKMVTLGIDRYIVHFFAAFEILPHPIPQKTASCSYDSSQNSFWEIDLIGLKSIEAPPISISSAGKKY
jgi:hypothetical protein